MRNDLFDLGEPQTARMYQMVVQYSQLANLTRSEVAAFTEILGGIKSAAKKHPGDGLILLRGAYASTIAPIVHLLEEGRFNVTYVSLGGQISSKDLSPEQLAPEMERAIAVAKYCGFRDMESLGQAFEKPKDPAKRTLTVCVQNEVRNYGMSTAAKLDALEKKAHERLRHYLFHEGGLSRASFAFCSIQGANVQELRVASTMSAPRSRIATLIYDIKASGVYVELGTFSLSQQRTTSSNRPLASSTKAGRQPVRVYPKGPGRRA
jgi:hypothetical protein